MSGRRRAASAFEKLQATGFRLRWRSLTAIDDSARKKASKTKYICSNCSPNAWAKPETQLICGECYDEGEGDICEMEAEENGEAEQAA